MQLDSYKAWPDKVIGHKSPSMLMLTVLSVSISFCVSNAL